MMVTDDNLYNEYVVLGHMCMDDNARFLQHYHATGKTEYLDEAAFCASLATLWFKSAYKRKMWLFPVELQTKAGV